MATIANTHLTLSDMFQRQGIAAGDIIELLNKNNEVTRDIPWIPANKGGTHLTTTRTGLSSATWTALYQGVPQSKSSVQSVEDTTGMVEASSTVDERMLEVAENADEVRRQESAPHIESLAQECAKALFYYSSKTNAKHPMGLGARFNTIGTSGIGRQVIDGGGAGSDNTSIWFITWGPNFVHGIYPRAAPAGLQQIDRGRQRVTDENDDPYFVLQEDFRWHMGFSVRDWRNVVRIANIDVSDAAAGTVDLYALMRRAYYSLNKVWSGGIADQESGGATYVYANRSIIEALDSQATTNNPSDKLRITPNDVQGGMVTTYRGIPVRVTDAILNTESLVA